LVRLSVFFTFLAVTRLGFGQLAVIQERDTPCVFSGTASRVTVRFRNNGEKQFADDVTARLCQTSSTTAMPVGESLMGRLTVLPAQTVVQDFMLKFPTVKAETRLLVQWIDNERKVLGTTMVRSFPPDLLRELKSMAGEDGLGILDPQKKLTPALKSIGVDFADLENSGLENFHGRIAIVGPFESKAQMREGLAKQIETIADKGVAVVWFQPPPGRREKLQPSFYTLPFGDRAVVVVQDGVVSNLSDSPQAQLNLIDLARLALHPHPLRLPDLTPQP